MFESCAWSEVTNVAGVETMHLCNACGGCNWICPTRAIQLVETVSGHLVPEIDKGLCNGCGLCMTICPGKGFGASLSSRTPFDPFVGNILSTHIGKANDPLIYSESQSGGAVTSLLTAALDSREIGGALTVSFNDRLRPLVLLATDFEKLILSQKSKYCPVPLLANLELVKSSKSPVAVVGLPCHLHGLQNILDIDLKLKSKIAFTIGLVCDRIMTYAALDYLLSKSESKHHEVDFFSYRDKACGGYPGNVHIVRKDGRSICLPSRNRTKIKDFFTPPRCRLCFDKLNIFADIVVGDPHGVFDFDRLGGESVVIVRTDAGKRLLDHSVRNNYFSARDIPSERIIHGQSIALKRTDWYGYSHAWKKMGFPLPDYFPIVEKSAVRHNSVSVYRNSLKHSLALENYSDRFTLVSFARRHLLLKNMKRLFTLPFKLFKRIRNYCVD